MSKQLVHNGKQVKVGSVLDCGVIIDIDYDLEAVDLYEDGEGFTVSRKWDSLEEFGFEFQTV